MAFEMHTLVVDRCDLTFLFRTHTIDLLICITPTTYNMTPYSCF